MPGTMAGTHQRELSLKAQQLQRSGSAVGLQGDRWARGDHKAGRTSGGAARDRFNSFRKQKRSRRSRIIKGSSLLLPNVTLPSAGWLPF